MPPECDEEVVADSEDEISPYSVEHKGQMVLVDGLTGAQDTVQTATVLAAKKSGMPNDNISFFTENSTSKSVETSISSFAPNTSTNSLARTTTSRPRPRPAYKGTAAIANAISSIGTSPSIPNAHSPRASTVATSFPNVQMGSSNPASWDSPQPDATFSIAERAKMRSRNTSKLTPPISLISTPPPIVKPRPKPKRVSISKTPVEVINLTSDEEDELALPPLKLLIKPRVKSKPSPKSPSKISQTETAKSVNSSRHTALTSEARLTNTRPTSVSSQLPPAIIQDHPPIAFLPDDSDADIFLSSSPLFSSPPTGRTKRKRQEASNFDIRDNMDVDTQTMPPPRFFGSSSSDTQGSLPPPPPLFAPSSSLMNDSGIEIDSPVPVSSKPAARKNTDKNKTPAHEEPQKKGKKKSQIVDDDDFEIDTIRPPPRKKTKASAKTKKDGKKGADVVDPRSSKVFKSSEFIEDDEDPDNGLFSPVTGQVSTMVTAPAVGTTAPSAQPQSDLSSVPDSDASAVPQKKGKKKVTTEIVVNSKRKPRKGKPVVMSDDDDDGAIIGGDESGESVALNKSDQASNRKGKEKGRAAKKPDVLEKPEDGSDELEGANNAIKENRPISHNASPPASTPKQPAAPLSSRSYSIAARTKSTPMSELIRRVNSLPGSPFAATPQRGPATPASTAYSPYLKASRSALSRIAPLHPNRRTPPPPLPRPPPPKKTKKQLEREEKWEEELQEGVEGWATLTDEERAAMRRAKRAMDEGWEE